MKSYQPIRVLSEQVTRKIAAGEVIERPSSIVKELMENSVDAFATRIQVSVSNGGMSEILVEDDGIGISHTDIPLTVEKNATSKIESDADLTRLQTFGFRGEALSSISAVSKFELHSKRKEDDTGSFLQVDGGAVKNMQPAGTADGTRIQVSNLFFNTPARKKFLRSKSTEFSHIEKTFKKIALAHPEIHFTLYKDGTVDHQLAAVLTDQERILQLYPSISADSLVPFETTSGNIRVRGFVSNSQDTFSSSQEIWMFVNRRWITDRMLQKAVLEGYRTALMEHRYPMSFVYIDMEPHQFDVNVHPTKSEVRFEKPQEMYQTLVRAISSALVKRPADHQPTFTKTLTNSMAHPFFSYGSHSKPYPTNRNTWAPAAEAAPTYTTKTTGFFSQLEFLGSLDHTYILCRSGDTLVIIDQHAAHERVLFEQFKKNSQNKSAMQQPLLVPLTLPLTSGQLEIVRNLQPTLKNIGFELDEFGDNACVVRAIPASLKEKNCRQILMDFIEQASNETKSRALEDHQDHVISTMACHAAVRAHDALGFDEIHHLLSQMDQVDLSSYCPHGRPTFLKLSVEHLEVLFKRT